MKTLYSYIKPPMPVKFFISLFFWSAGFALEYKDIAGREEFVKLAEKLAAGPLALSADFTEEKHMSILEQPALLKGVFYFRKPASIRWEYHEPHDTVIVMHNKKIQLRQEGKIITVGENRQAGAANEEIARILQGNLSAATGAFLQRFYFNGQKYMIELDPVEKKTRTFIGKITIYINAADFTVTRIVISEPSGDYTNILFSNVNNAARLEDSLFILK
ncbi:MAG: hypothetical protein A2096_04830 [Spirochaetes bacterium GWF1_41_5]|nr:MAG: hypothetical protein A2096_04830 [Spirochaetes bacterium GWF1_41_5]HBE00871.1 hypothetical protein [Spirochaetia bacterium]